MKRHVILDTDIGCDPDDAFALLLALNSPKEISLELIVTSDDIEGKRVKFVKKILELHNERNIPIVKGCSLESSKYFVVDKLIEGVDFHVNSDYLKEIRENVLKNKETYYVCIGPATNLSNFIKEYPKLARKLKIIIMGGLVQPKFFKWIEHNLRLDAEAARNVVSSGLNISMITVDVTSNKRIMINPLTEVYKKLKSSENSIHHLLLDHCNLYFKKFFPVSFLHDPLALSVLIGNFVNFYEKSISVNDEGRIKLIDNGKKVKLSKDANYEEFMNLFKERIFKNE